MTDIEFIEIEKALFELLPRKRNGLWGFVDHDSKEVIPFIYDYAEHFSDDLALVKQGDNYGFIDLKGKLIIPFIFDDAKSFHNELCPVKANGKWGVIDTSGEYIIKPQYDYIGSFNEEHGQLVAEVVLNGRKGLVDSMDKIILGSFEN